MSVAAARGVEGILVRALWKEEKLIGWLESDG